MKANTIILTMSSTSMTGTNVRTSQAIPIDQLWGFAIQVVWTGTPTGTFKLQASCDAPAQETQTSNGGPYVITNWDDVTDSPYSVAGAAGSYTWNVREPAYRFVRLVYTNASGSGTITSSKLSAKGV